MPRSQVKTKPGMSPSARRKARVLAVQALYEWHVSANSLRSIEQAFREDNDMSKVDDSYFVELLHKIPACLTELDDLIAPLLDRPRDELTPVELAILRIGAYELTYRSDVPFKVVINEAVDLSKKFGASDSHKYVNAVLDGLARRSQKS